MKPRHATPPRRPLSTTVIAALLLSFTIFCAVVLLSTMYASPADPNPTEVAAPTGRVRRVTLFFTNASELTGSVLLTVDTRQMKLEALGYSPGQEIGGRPLEDIYRHEGAACAQELLCGEREVAGDGHLTFSVSNVAALLVYLNNRVSLTLPEKVGSIPAGESTFAPIQVADLLRYNGWSNGEIGRADIHAQVVAAVFNRYLTRDRDLEADFCKLTELCDDRLSISQFQAVAGDLAALAEANRGNLCSIVTAKRG